MGNERKEIFYFTLRTVAKALTKEAMEWRGLCTSEALQALVDGLEDARKDLDRVREQSEAGH